MPYEVEQEPCHSPLSRAGDDLNSPLVPLVRGWLGLWVRVLGLEVGLVLLPVVVCDMADSDMSGRCRGLSPVSQCDRRSARG